MKTKYMLLSVPLFFWLIALSFIIFSGYMFYFADCQTVKEYWYLVETPGRCI